MRVIRYTERRSDREIGDEEERANGRGQRRTKFQRETQVPLGEGGGVVVRRQRLSRYTRRMGARTIGIRHSY